MGNGRILVVEDNPSMLLLYSELGVELGRPIEAVGDGRDGLQRGLSEPFDLVILDLSLPHLGGMEICRQLRERRPDLPILMVTSRVEQSDKILGFEVGADDYVTKPFHMPELIARVTAILRRQRAYQSSGAMRPQNSTPVLRFDELEIDQARRKIRRDGVELEFSALEFDVIAYLAVHAGKPVSREVLLSDVWGYSPSSSENFDATLSSTLSRIRTKLEPTPERPKFIMTVRGVGYRFVEPTSSEE